MKTRRELRDEEARAGERELFQSLTNANSCNAEKVTTKINKTIRFELFPRI